MSYYLTTKQGTKLSAFYSGDLIEKSGDLLKVFARRRNDWLSFESVERAENYKKYMIETCKKQRNRWGDYVENAIKFVNNLIIIKND